MKVHAFCNIHLILNCKFYCKLESGGLYSNTASPWGSIQAWGSIQTVILGWGCIRIQPPHGALFEHGALIGDLRYNALFINDEGFIHDLN